MNRLTIGVLAALALPATASAAPLNELPFEPRAATEMAGCVDATGVPGGLAALGSYSRDASDTDLRVVSASGIAHSARVTVGRLLDCAAVAQAGRAAIVAGIAFEREGRELRSELRAVVRDPSGDYGQPQRLSDSAAGPAVAVAPDGRGVVAWRDRAGGRTRVVAARREPGGAFGAPEVLSSWRTSTFDEVDLEAAIGAAGNVTLLWARERSRDREVVEVATAAPGGAFTVQRLARGAGYGSAPELSVAPDGWALVAYEASEVDDVPKVFERAPGAARFTAVALPNPLPPDERFGWSVAEPVVAIRDGGGAMVAWRTGAFESQSGVDAMTRETAGTFVARRVAAPVGRPVFGSVLERALDFLDPLAQPPVGFERATLEVALSADGRLVLAWPAPAGQRPLTGLATRAAVGRLDGTFEPARTIGAPVRDVGDIAPLFTEDGRAAVVWADNDTRPGDGRLHVAVEGAPEPAPAAAPRVTLRAPRFQRLYASQSVRVRARCEAACDVRATVLGPRGSSGDVIMTRLRRGAFSLRPGSVDAINPGKPRRVRVVVHATAPGGGETTERSLRVRVARRPSLPVRAPLRVTARRRGDEILVRWRTRAPARRQSFIVAGHAGPGVDAEAGALVFLNGGGKRRFRVWLQPADPDRVRYVTVFAQGHDSFEDGPHEVVRVR